MESSQNFKKAIDEIEISVRLDAVVADAIERAKTEQAAPSRRFISVRKLCLAAAAALAVCVGAGTLYRLYGIDIQKSADNAAAPEQMNEANMAASNQGRTVPSPEIEPFSSAGDGMEAAGAEPAEASVEQDPPQSIQDRQSSKPDADETKDGNSASRTEANDTAKNDSINTLIPVDPAPEKGGKTADGADLQDNGEQTPATMNSLPESGQEYLVTVTLPKDFDPALIAEQLKPFGEAIPVDADDFVTGNAAGSETGAVNNGSSDQQAGEVSLYYRVTLSGELTKAELEQAMQKLGIPFETRAIVSAQD